MSFSWNSSTRSFTSFEFRSVDAQRGGEPDGRGDVDGAAAVAALLSPPGMTASSATSLRTIERAAVDRSADLVRADRDHVRSSAVTTGRPNHGAAATASVWVRHDAGHDRFDEALTPSSG